MTASTNKEQQTTVASAQEQTSLPLGIKIFCVLLGLGAVAEILGGLFILGPGGLLFVGLGVVGLLIVYGLWTVKEWGWKQAMAWFGLGLLVNGFNVITAANASARASFIFGVPLVVLILIYLYQKRHFYTDAVAG